MPTSFDVAVIGSGPAGLQAALTLARGQRTVCVVEGTRRRNDRAHAIHNVLSRDGVLPGEFREAAWDDLRRYGVVAVPGDLISVDGEVDSFTVQAGNETVQARRLLLATGMRDELPPWPGLAPVWGPTVFQCPFCHGHELRGLRWGVVVRGPEGAGHVALLRAWTRDLTVFTEGWIPDEDVSTAWTQAGVKVHTTPVIEVLARADDATKLAAVRTETTEVPLDALLLHPAQDVSAPVHLLGLARNDAGFVDVGPRNQTSRPGVWAAGDLLTPMQSAVGAMASGQLAAAAICFDLAGTG